MSFTNIYPMFERGRIMKKELSLALRNFSFGLARLQFDNCSDGIIAGCSISVDERRIQVAPGIFKFNRFVYVLNEAQNVPYEATEQFSSLKFRLSTTAAATADFVRYSGAAVLDNRIELKENEIEICRFKLQRGSRLRNDYTSFDDIQTEFDTINLAEATHAGIERPGFSQFVLSCFAKEALRHALTNPWDITFCTQCLRQEPMHRSVIEAYIIARLHLDAQEFTNLEIFHHLDYILRNIRAGTEIVPQKGGRRRRQIDME